MAVTFKQDIVQEAIANLLQQFKGKPNIQGLLSAYANQVQDLENMYKSVLNGRILSQAVGVQLDLLGELVGAARDGLNDDEFRILITTRIKQNKSSGTINEVIDIVSASVSIYTGVTAVVELREIFPASFYITLDQPLNDASAGERIGTIMKQSRAGGVNGFFQYDFEPPFLFAPTDVTVPGSPNGFADYLVSDAGLLSGVVGGPC